VNEGEGIVATEAFKILIVDDHAIVRQGLRQILAETPDLKVEGEAANGQEALDLLRGENKKWGLAILDISLPDRSGLDLLKQFRNLHPKLPVLVLTMHAEDQYAVRVLRAGAAGFLTKESAPDELVRAIRQIKEGFRYVSPSIAQRLVLDLTSDNDPEMLPHQSLSDREFEVMQMIVAGQRLTHIAEKLHLSVKTISSHRARILSKIRMQSNAELVRYALHHGLQS
jgi:DNA-binding NarL/FixJ family response regulator